MNMSMMNERHIPAIAEPINKAQPLNYADILKEMDVSQPQQSNEPAPPPPPALIMEPSRAPEPHAPTVRFADPVVQMAPFQMQKKAAVPLPVDKGPVDDSFFVRYRRHLFVAAVAFAVLHYASPYLGTVPYLSNGLVRSAATAAIIGGLFYAGDVFILSPETIVEVAR
jgi:hypothetical protein